LYSETSFNVEVSEKIVATLITVFEFAAQYRVGALVVIGIGIIYYLVRVLLDEDKSALWRARIYKAVYRISGKSSAEKKYIANDITSRINLARRRMPFAKEYLPRSVGVQWVEGGTGETMSLSNNEMVVQLDPADLEEKNIVLITSALVRRTSLAGIRHIMNRPLELSMDINLVKNLLIEIGDRRILDWYFRNEYQPALDESDEIKEWNEKITEIDERGLFTRLLLVELDNYSKQIIGKASSPNMLNEITGLIEFVFRIATKAYGQDAPLEYISRYIKIGVILVGETSKVLYDLGLYLKAFAFKLRRQLASIYVITFDKELLGSTSPEIYEQFVERTKELDAEIEQRFQIEKEFEIKYVCTDLASNKRKAKISCYKPHYI